MSTVKLTATIADISYADKPTRLGQPAGGRVATISLAVDMLPGMDQVLSEIGVIPGPWNISLALRGEYEDETPVGYVVAADSQVADRFSFLMPISRTGKTGFPMGAFVVTQGGVVGSVISYRYDTTDLARRLVAHDVLLPERVQLEQPAIEYQVMVIGGMVTTPSGMAYYYRPPYFPPMPLDAVHSGVQGPFFQINEKNQQATHLIARLSQLLSDQRLSPYIAAYIIRNAARAAKHDPGEYAEAILGAIDNQDRYIAIDAAYEAMPDVQREASPI